MPHEDHDAGTPVGPKSDADGHSAVYKRRTVLQGVRHSISNMIAERTSLNVYRSNMLSTPLEYAHSMMRWASLLALPIATSVLFAVLSFYGIAKLNPVSAFLLAFSFVVPLLFLSRIVALPWVSCHERRKACERELPFVATYLAMASASGMPIQRAFELIKDFVYLPAFRFESLRLDKLRRLYAVNMYEALLFEGKYHPSEGVKELYFASVSAQREGGEVCRAMKDELLKLFSSLQGRLRTMPDKFSLIASAEMVAFIIVPMAMITIGVLFSGLLGVPMLVGSCFALPTIMAFLLSVTIDSYLPREICSPAPLKNFIISMAALPSSVLVVIIANAYGFALPYHYILAIFLIGFTFPASISYASSRRRALQILSALPSFIRSIVEDVKKGNSPCMAAMSFSEIRSFNKSFDRLLYRVAAFLKVGAPLRYSVLSSDAPWIAKVSFELLDKAEAMGAEAKSLDALSELVQNLYLSQRSLESQTRMFTLTSYVNSFVLAFSIVISVEVVARLFTGMADMTSSVGIPLGFSFITSAQFAVVESIAYAAVVYNSFLLGLLGGKVSNGGSIVDGLRPAIVCVLLSSICIFAFKDLGLMVKFMGGAMGFA